MFWADRVARDLINRRKFKYIDREFSKEDQTIETGTSLSGVPHIGNASDVLRGEAIRRALEEIGVKVELIWVADDVDPFRKIPLGFPSEFEKYLGKPVFSIPCPNGECDSFSEYYSELFIESLREYGVKLRPYSSRKLYKSGELTEEVKIAIENSKKIREIINKYRERPLDEDWVPWKPICEECGKIITTRVTEKLDEYSLEYVCEDYSFKHTKIEGCGHRGISDIRDGEGKLVWRSEWAARWRLFQVTCEPFGKEHATKPGGSFWVNGEICEKVFGWPEPYPVIYEFVLGEGGEKMASSKGNVITTWEWLEIAPPEALKLLFYKKIEKQREFSPEKTIPALVDELDKLERIYFGVEKMVNRRKLMSLKRLYEMCQVRSPPNRAPIRVPFTFLAVVSQIAKTGEEIIEILRRTSHIKAELDVLDKEELISRAERARNWVNKYGPESLRFEFSDEFPAELKLEEKEVMAIEAIANFLIEANEFSERDLKDLVYSQAREKEINPKKLFRLLYTLIIGKEKGPRLYSLVSAIGSKRVGEKLMKVAKSVRLG